MKVLASVIFMQLIGTSLFAQGDFEKRKKIISRIDTYYFPKDRGGYVGVNDANIKTSPITLRFEIIDSICLGGIEKEINKLKSVKSNRPFGSIYLLCDIVYKDGTKGLISFEKANGGLIRLNGKIFQNLPSLEGLVIKCNN